MKRFLLSIFFINYALVLFSQKPPIDTSAIRNWPSMQEYGTSITNNGKFFLYTINNKPVSGNTLVVRSIDGSWQKEIPDASPLFFTEDSRQLVFTDRDTLFFLTLGTDEQTYVSGVVSYKWPGSGRKEMIAYQQNNPEKALVLHNLITGQDNRFSSVTDFSFDENGKVLLLKQEIGHGNSYSTSLQWVSLRDVTAHQIWSSDSLTIRGYSFDTAGSQLVFSVAEREAGKFVNSIWYYKIDIDKAIMKVDERSAGIDSGLSINNYPPYFSRNGNWIFFQIQSPVDDRKPKPDAVQVDVWNYKDVVLQSEQLNSTNPSVQKKNSFITIVNVNIKSNRVRRLETETEEIATDVNKINGDILILYDRAITVPWWRFEQRTFHMISLKDGSRKFLKQDDYSKPTASPEGKYVVYYDRRKRNYFSYDIEQGKLRNISLGINQKLGNEDEYNAQGYSLELGIAGWIEHDAGLLVYDNYDIWLIDPSGKKAAVNITNGYGNLHHVKLRLVYEKDDQDIFIVHSANDSLLLTGYDVFNKYNGFFRKCINEKRDPELLTMGPYTFYHTESQVPSADEYDNGMRPVKARDANIWIVKRQTASEAPNYFLTDNLKDFRPLTDLQPQKRYNWLTTELVSWRQLDGTTSQGILYKPEDFNPKKRYPLIFECYEQFSYLLFEYPQPELARARIDIPWFVSHGYLVFTPDIHYSVANLSDTITYQHAYNSIVSAARYLAKKPWIDAGRIGLNGHSFGGGETINLIAHTHLFAAAAEAAGRSDFVSAYSTLSDLAGTFDDVQEVFEVTHERFGLGATLWKRQDLYLRSSSVLMADHINTPLLIMHNKADNAINWGQGVEMFLALRRLEKRVWMLQYDHGGHMLLSGSNDAADFTIRIAQFFDHYLKGALPPKWMTDGIPGNLKGIESGLELDKSGKRP